MRAKIFALAVAMALALSGCDYTDPDRMAIITGAAVDFADGEYELTIEVIKTEGSALDEPIETELFTVSAPTLDAAEEGLKKLCGAALYWGHAQALVLSEAAAERALEPAVDWVLRDGELRLNVVLGISAADDAKAILAGEHSGSYTVGSALASAVRRGEFSARRAGATAHRMVEAVRGEGAAIVPAFSLAEQDEEREYAVVDGGAVVGADGFLGFVGGEEARCLLLLLGADEDYEILRDERGEYGLALKGVEVERSAEIDDAGDAVVRLSLAAECDLRYYGADGALDGKSAERIMSEGAALLCERVTGAIESARDLGADAAGLASALEPLVGEEKAHAAALGCAVEVSAELRLSDTGLVVSSPLG